MVPPVEYDPATADELTELVEVAATGTVTTWSWEPDPDRAPAPRPTVRLGAGPARRRRHRDAPRGRRRLDGRDRDRAAGCGSDGPTSARAPSPTSPASSWSEDGVMTDLVLPESLRGRRARRARSARRPASTTRSPPAWRSPSSSTASPTGACSGPKCPECGKVYVPIRNVCPTDAVDMPERVEVPDTGRRHHVLRGQRPVLRPGDRGARTCAPPSCSTAPTWACSAWSRECRPTRCGWGCGSRPSGPTRPTTSLESIEHWEPTGEPDAEYDTYKHHL